MGEGMEDNNYEILIKKDLKKITILPIVLGVLSPYLLHLFDIPPFYYKIFFSNVNSDGDLQICLAGFFLIFGFLILCVLMFRKNLISAYQKNDNDIINRRLKILAIVIILVGTLLSVINFLILIFIYYDAYLKIIEYNNQVIKNNNQI